MLPPLPLRCLGSPGPSPLGAFVYNRFFLGRAGQGKRRNRDAPSPATKFLIRSHAMVRVPSSASARVQRGIGGSWDDTSLPFHCRCCYNDPTHICGLSSVLITLKSISSDPASQLSNTPKSCCLVDLTSGTTDSPWCSRGWRRLDLEQELPLLLFVCSWRQCGSTSTWQTV